LTVICPPPKLFESDRPGVFGLGSYPVGHRITASKAQQHAVRQKERTFCDFIAPNWTTAKSRFSLDASAKFAGPRNPQIHVSARILTVALASVGFEFDLGSFHLLKLNPLVFTFLS